LIKYTTPKIGAKKSDWVYTNENALGMSLQPRQGDKKQMKTIAVILLFCSLFCSCSKRDYSNAEKQEEEKQEVLTQETPGQETQSPDVSYVFDIDSFLFLDEFPKTITDIKVLFPDEHFEEKTFENDVKGLLGEYVYSLYSANIRFGFWGDTTEEAVLLTSEIFNPKYQCKSMQIIGMPVKELESLSGNKLDPDKKINISNDLYVLSIKTDGNTVKSYTILREL
jgi:hypothetical protein